MKATPTRFWLRHPIWHRRRRLSLSTTSVKASGIPIGFVTSRHAPATDMLWTTQSTPPPLLKMMVPAFKVRWRWVFRRSIMVKEASTLVQISGEDHNSTNRESDDHRDRIGGAIAHFCHHAGANKSPADEGYRVMPAGDCGTEDQRSQSRMIGRKD